jgi:hypothetical protein
MGSLELEDVSRVENVWGDWWWCQCVLGWCRGCVLGVVCVCPWFGRLLELVKGVSGLWLGFLYHRRIVGQSRRLDYIPCGDGK